MALRAPGEEKRVLIPRVSKKRSKNAEKKGEKKAEKKKAFTGSSTFTG